MAIQHLLPQDISNYRFRLIGDMTIKQFASLAICIVLAIITYSMPLPFFFKYPLVFLFIVLGVGMAFVPVQGRSLDIWIIAFIKSIYSPTQYSWKSTPATAETAETAAPTSQNNESVRQVSNPSMEITQGITTQTQQTSPFAAQKQVTTTPSPTTPVATTSEPTTVTPITPTPPKPESTSPSISTTPTSTPQNNIPSEPPKPVSQPQSNTSAPTPQPVSTPPIAVTQAPPTTNLPIPFTPSTPNTLVGLTLTPSGHILDSVMVEIKRNDLTLRATKSNKLGQFMFARPLESGTYQILAEKEGNTFSPYSLELTGNIVKPLKIQAQ